ncbi:MAG: NAD(P)/FAD-dependent oxidoreductase [Myxococcales bacterium]|nr:NAD(P)/FAD-dependent oxidoreductase [Myxococcales bacterium]
MSEPTPLPTHEHEALHRPASADEPPAPPKTDGAGARVARSGPRQLAVLILGSGFSGLGLAMQLKAAGIHDFLVLERAARLGGTWRDNHYPGCACDVPSHLYSFASEPNPRWSRAYSPHDEILRYLEGCAERHGLGPHLRFGQEARTATWDEEGQRWEVVTAAGDTFHARVLVSGIGALSNPTYAKVPGLESFEGKQFHSATWDHDYPLEGKRVGVIGTGASAIQFIPQIQPRVSHLTVFQRTPPWILPKPDRAFSELEKVALERIPPLRRLYREAIYWRAEGRAVLFTRAPGLMKLAAALGRRHIRKSLRSPRLREIVTPRYVPGCKRILVSNDYYPALEQANVEVVTDALAEVTRTGVRLASGRPIALDALIHGTGFTVQSALGSLTVHGRDGRELGAQWRADTSAYRGTTVAGYPNLFTLLGPNTALGHSSVVLMIEAQLRYVMSCLDHMARAGLTSVDVRPDVQRDYNDALQDALGRTVWASGCESWYLDARGKNTTIYPGFTFTFRRETATFRPEEYAVRRGVAAIA